MFNSHPLGSSPLARGLRRVLGLPPDRSGIIPARAGFTIPASLCSASRADHPRSRGVYPRATSACASPCGSSPLARGLPVADRPSCILRRIIPARAGFTRGHADAAHCPPDHPRSRGVYTRTATAPSRLPGSSPLARGLLVVDGEAERGVGIIPARAGFTRRARPMLGGHWDHPRSRGVYDITHNPICEGYGSSPLARGLQRLDAQRVGREGIIPARAGFTVGRAGPGRRRRDHPRSRGVYWTSCHRFDPALGSSPLARGLPGHGHGAPHGGGIIPARAGFTGPRGRPCGRWWDHPRSRGVYAETCPARPSASGSSPLARGLLYRAWSAETHAGIIPARAGFTIPCFGYPKLSPDHPRSRGVYRSTWPASRRSRGSSPLARGLPRGPDDQRRDPGIIPARAGFTNEGLFFRRDLVDHPRSRGVYETSRIEVTWSYGSSPLARGLLRRYPANLARSRIIPARAGFTHTSAVGWRPSPDHPRSRGVYPEPMTGW